MKFDHCIDCGVSSLESTLSRRGLCINCATQRVWDAVEEMTKREGPIYEKYLEGIRRFCGQEQEA